MKRLAFFMLACVLLAAMMLPLSVGALVQELAGPAEQEAAQGVQESALSDAVTDGTSEADTEEDTEEDAAQTPAWQAFVEQEIVPGVIFIFSCACMVYIAISPLLARMRRASDKYSAAADDANLISGSARESTDEVKRLRTEMTALQEKLQSDIATLLAEQRENLSALQAEDREKIAELKAEQSAREDKLRGLLETGVRMMSLAFSHESELVKNGTAREIMRVVEENEGKEP